MLIHLVFEDVKIGVRAVIGRPEATGFACHQVAGYNCQWQQI
jgi:hypothetical protein